jgi:glutamyl-Q tRNA(Asp) synthetase
LEARKQCGRWLVRIEDIDPPREQAGADSLIIDALERYGFEWDGPVRYQHNSRAQHEAALKALIERHLTYPCGCSRRDLSHAPRGPLGIRYPGTCRDGTKATETAIRVRTDNAGVTFRDRLQGEQTQHLESESGDFVIWRRDGLVSYHLAVVVDDHLQGVTDVVRGIDLMDSTPRQIYLQGLLGYQTPHYAHIPVAVHADGNKLSKLTGATGISTIEAGETLVVALTVLNQQPPSDLDQAPLAEIWGWALENWRIEKLRGLKAVAAGSMRNDPG